MKYLMVVRFLLMKAAFRRNLGDFSHNVTEILQPRLLRGAGFALVWMTVW